MNETTEILQALFAIGSAMAMIVITLFAAHYVSNICRYLWARFDRRKRNVPVETCRRKKRWYHK